MRFYTVLKLGPNRETTREGFTLFRNVSVSRTGEQIYGPEEIPSIEPAEDGFVHIFRTPEEVFRPETLESGNGKSFVIFHPEEDVQPENWRDLTHGIMFNMRRGTGDQRDESVCDLMIYTAEALREIDLGMRELSLGYDTDYFKTGPGRGEQRNIYINHVALLPTGRCGGRCAIRDHAQEKNPMSSRLKRVLDAIAGVKDDAELRRVLDKARDEEEENEKKDREKEEARKKEEDKSRDAKDEEFKKEVRDGFKSISDAIVKAIDKKGKDEEEEEAKRKTEAEAKDKARDDEEEAEMEEETGSKDARKARDSQMLSESFESIKMNAEIIAPGIQIPTFDAAAEPKKTFRDCICGFRRKVLQTATADAETAELIKAVRGRSLDSAEVTKLSCGQVRTIFNGVAAMKKNRNNAALTVDQRTQNQTKTEDKSPIEQFKAASQARWK